MVELFTLHVFSTALLGVIVGGMLFFAAFFAPLVFIKLKAATAAGFLRALFPWYYATFAALSATSAWLLSHHRLPQDAFAMAAVAAGFVFGGIALNPKLSDLSERRARGDAAASTQFRWLHRVSLALNTVQLLMATGIYLRAIAL
jgi:hypothetical protein